MTKRALIKRAKSIVCKKDAGKRLEHASSLDCQDRVFRCCEDSAASMWSSVVQKLPSELLKFSLNAVQDTLPHNDKLARWRKNEGLSSCCKLCGEREGGREGGREGEGERERLCGERQTLLHVLNACTKALSLCRYNERHDAVLGTSHFLCRHTARGVHTHRRPSTVPAVSLSTSHCPHR